jgi:hypothetical protein
MIEIEFICTHFKFRFALKTDTFLKEKSSKGEELLKTISKNGEQILKDTATVVTETTKKKIVDNKESVLSGGFPGSKFFKALKEEVSNDFKKTFK